MVNRDDAFGKYYFDAEGKARSCKMDGPVDDALLHKHFAANRIIGLYSTSKKDACRWLTIDIDRHEGDPEECVERNVVFARHLFEDLRVMKFDPLLSDSNGKGGYHLTVLFDEPAQANRVHSFGSWLVRDWRAFGLSQQPEVFPKQPTIKKRDGSVGYGNFVRLFGKHYKRDHYSKVWDGNEWLDGQAAIELILDKSGDSFRLAPPEALSHREAKEGRRPWWKQYDGDLKTLDISGLFESRRLGAIDKGGGQFEVECPWADQHTTGGEAAYIKATDPERGLFPTFFCHHHHCEGRTFEDVLAFFGKRAVDRHCGGKFGRDRTKEEQGDRETIDPSDPLGTARAYHRMRGQSLVHHLGQWRRWDGKLYRDVADADVRADLWKWLATCRDERSKGSITYSPKPAAVNATLDALRAEANVPLHTAMPRWLGEAEGPRPENIVAFDNGLLDIEGFIATGEPRLMSHTPRWFSHTCLPHGFDPQAECPLWLETLGLWFEGDVERMRALGQWFGYCLTSDIRQHKFALLIGPPRSGKGTTMRVLSQMLGAHNVANPTLTSLGSRFGLAPLVGKLAALVGDGHLGRQSDSTAILERLKSITGGDPQNVDRKNAVELANVPLKARFTIAVNELPRFPDASAALRSRMLVIPYRVSFEGHEDFDLADRLLVEIPGITNWAMNGLMDLRRAGRMLQPQAGRDILDAFGRLSSPVMAFLHDGCEVGSGHWTRADVLRAAWVKWCEQHGHEPGSEANFGAKLRAVNPLIERTRRREGGRQHYGYVGVRLDAGQ